MSQTNLLASPLPSSSNARISLQPTLVQEGPSVSPTDHHDPQHQAALTLVEMSASLTQDSFTVFRRDVSQIPSAVLFHERQAPGLSSTNDSEQPLDIRYHPSRSRGPSSTNDSEQPLDIRYHPSRSRGPSVESASDDPSSTLHPHTQTTTTIPPRLTQLTQNQFSRAESEEAEPIVDIPGLPVVRELREADEVAPSEGELTVDEIALVIAGYEDAPDPDIEGWGTLCDTLKAAFIKFGFEAGTSAVAQIAPTLILSAVKFGIASSLPAQLAVGGIATAGLIGLGLTTGSRGVRLYELGKSDNPSARAHNIKVAITMLLTIGSAVGAGAYKQSVQLGVDLLLKALSKYMGTYVRDLQGVVLRETTPSAKVVMSNGEAPKTGTGDAQAIDKAKTVTSRVSYFVAGVGGELVRMGFNQIPRSSALGKAFIDTTAYSAGAVWSAGAGGFGSVLASARAAKKLRAQGHGTSLKVTGWDPGLAKKNIAKGNVLQKTHTNASVRCLLGVVSDVTTVCAELAKGQGPGVEWTVAIGRGLAKMINEKRNPIINDGEAAEERLKNPPVEADSSVNEIVADLLAQVGRVHVIIDEQLASVDDDRAGADNKLGGLYNEYADGDQYRFSPAGGESSWTSLSGAPREQKYFDNGDSNGGLPPMREDQEGESTPLLRETKEPARTSGVEHTDLAGGPARTQGPSPTQTVEQAHDTFLQELQNWSGARTHGPEFANQVETISRGESTDSVLIMTETVPAALLRAAGAYCRASGHPIARVQTAFTRLDA